jgi:transposase
LDRSRPHERVHVTSDNATTHQDDEVEAVLRGAADHLVLLYPPTCRPWLDPIEMLWRQLRREVTHCELLESVEALLTATNEFFERYNRTLGRRVFFHWLAPHMTSERVLGPDHCFLPVHGLAAPGP